MYSLRSFGYLVLMMWGVITPLCVDGTEVTVKTVRACGDAAEWPPYLFMVRGNSGETEKVGGYTPALVREVLALEKSAVVVDLAPWRRCLREVAKGTHYQILLDATVNSERQGIYHVSRPIYQMTPSYFYSKRHYPDGLPIKRAEDLKNYRINGIHGYNYVDYGLTEDDLEGRVDGHEILIRKLHRGRIDLFIEWSEVFGGFREIGKPFIDDPDLGYAAIPGLEKTTMHLMFSRSELGWRLKQAFDRRLEEMESSGRLEELIGEYVKP